MDLLSKWNQRMREDTFPAAHSQEYSVPEMIRDFTGNYLRLWWSCERTLPAFHANFSIQEQAEREKKLEKLADGMLYEIKHAPRQVEERNAWAEQLQSRLQPVF